MAMTRNDGLMRLSFTVQGKRYYVYGKNEIELGEKVAQKKKEIEEGILSRENPTIEEYYTRRIEFRKDGLTPNTVRHLQRARNSVCRVYIESAHRRFGEIRIKQITSDDLFCLQNKMKETCKTETINGHLSKLKHVMCDAIKERIISYNPFDMITSLKRTEEKARETYHRALTIEEQKAFFDCPLTKQSNYYNVFRMAINTGMRLGEIGALKYKDIKSDYFIVQRTITRTHGDAYGIGEDTKTAAGRRKIPINDNIRQIIEDQKKVNTERNGNNVIDMEAVLFAAPRGGLIYGQYVNNEIKKICDEIGMEIFTSHAFRDTFATRAIESGMNPKTLQEILGHKDYAITMNLYCHVMDQTKKNEMNNLQIIV